MDKLLNAIKCHHCKQTLQSPIVLPCGHSTCKVHADESGDQVKCPKCGVWHQNKGFSINTELLAVIESQISSTALSPCQKEAKEACDKLEDILDQIGAVIKDPIYYSHQAIDVLKHRVLLKSEQLKLAIDEKTEKLLAVLTEYQNKCELNVNKSNLKYSLKNLEIIKEETEKMLRESINFLNHLEVDDEKCASIKKECGSKADVLNKEFEIVKKFILMNEFEEKADQVGLFVDLGTNQIDLDPVIRTELLGINSKILEAEQKTQLREICKISPQTKWKLLYRGSRDGYGAGDFHSKCDNISKTITIIETTDFYIFGGYTKQTWNGSGYGRDPHAYIFSLVNDFHHPCVMKISKPEWAIQRNELFGPTFGRRAIRVSNDSNSAMINNSNIKNNCVDYLAPEEIRYKFEFLAGSNNFQVKEIEVFQLE